MKGTIEVEKYNYIELVIENLRFFNRLDNSPYFKYKPIYKPPYTESKKGFSNTLARALAKACMDKYENVLFFDDFDSYYVRSNKIKYAFKNQNIFTSKIYKNKSGPDLICKGHNGELVIVECKGRLSQYSKKDLKDFIFQSNNAQAKDNFGNAYKTKHFAIPFYISFNNDNSTLSIVDPQNEGKSAKDDNLNSIERRHYSRVLRNLGYEELALQLLENQNDNDESKFEINVATCILDNKQYVISENSLLSNFFYRNDILELLDLYSFNNNFTYCLELSKFRHLKDIIQNKNSNFNELYSVVNEKNNYLSNDGAFLIHGNEIKEITQMTV